MTVARSWRPSGNLPETRDGLPQPLDGDLTHDGDRRGVQQIGDPRPV